MLITLINFIKRGVIDNSKRDLIKLSFYGQDESRPLELSLEGNCCRDIAGCCLSFENGSFSDSSEEPWEFLRHLSSSCKDWLAGDISLSGRRREGNNRAYVTNYLSLEFFAGSRMRLLFETECLQCSLSKPEWTMDWVEGNIQSLQSMDNMRAHIQFCLGNHLKSLAAADSEFPRCPWDDVLNRAETAVTIANSLKGKYASAYSELASLAYVFDLPGVLNQLADDEESNTPPSEGKIRLGLGLFEYLDAESVPHVKTAMEHPLFTCTSRLTDLSFSCLNEAIRVKVCTAEQVNELRSKYSVIVSRILASIMLVESDTDYQLTVIYKRLNIIKRDLSVMLSKLPKKQSILDAFRSGAVELIASLDDFARALSHR